MWQSWGSHRWVVRFYGSATGFPFLMIPFSASFSFVSVVLLRLLIGWCFLLWGFPHCTSSWLSCGCSFVRFLASSLPVPHVLGLPVGLWALFCLGRISGSHRDGVLPLSRGSYLLGFLCSFSFLVMHMPFWFLCIGRFLLLSFSSSCLATLFLWVFSSRGSVLLFRGVFPSEVSVSVPS